MVDKNKLEQLYIKRWKLLSSHSELKMLCEDKLIRTAPMFKQMSNNIVNSAGNKQQLEDATPEDVFIAVKNELLANGNAIKELLKKQEDKNNENKKENKK